MSGESTQGQPAAPSLDIPSLDGIRAVSVMIVMLSHAGFGDIVPGGLGVTIFFFLSGFLITTLMLREYAARGTVHIRLFYIRRIFRLAPPLLITLVIAYALTLTNVLPGSATWQGFFAQLFYFANYYALFFEGGQNVPKGTGILWSLAVEEHFYIVYPLLMLTLLRRATPRAICLLFAACCVLALAWRYALTSSGDFDPNRIYYATDTRLDSILFGCMLALLVHPLRVPTSPSASTLRGWLAMALGGSVIVASLLYREAQFRESLRYSLQGIALMPVFYYGITMVGTPVYRFLNWAPVRRLGVYSYAIYLVHHVIVYLLEAHFESMRSPVALLAATAILSVAYAAALDRWVDPRFRALRKRYHG